MALRKAEKEEEKRAREKILQKLEEDKVSNTFVFFSVFMSFPFPSAPNIIHVLLLIYSAQYSLIIICLFPFN